MISNLPMKIFLNWLKKKLHLSVCMYIAIPCIGFKILDDLKVP